MKKLILVALASSALAASPAMAKSTVADTQAGANGWTQSNSANSNACYGQARAYFAEWLASQGESNGQYISQRKGDNPQNNADFIAMYCGTGD